MCFLRSGHVKSCSLFFFLKKLEETPLHIAARIKDGTAVADMLLKSGANVDVPQEV